MQNLYLKKCLGFSRMPHGEGQIFFSAWSNPLQSSALALLKADSHPLGCRDHWQMEWSSPPKVTSTWRLRVDNGEVMVCYGATEKPLPTFPTYGSLMQFTSFYYIILHYLYSGLYLPAAIFSPKCQWCEDPAHRCSDQKIWFCWRFHPDLF